MRNRRPPVYREVSGQDFYAGQPLRKRTDDEVKEWVAVNAEWLEDVVDGAGKNPLRALCEFADARTTSLVVEREHFSSLDKRDWLPLYRSVNDGELDRSKPVDRATLKHYVASQYNAENFVSKPGSHGGGSYYVMLENIRYSIHIFGDDFNHGWTWQVKIRPEAERTTLTELNQREAPPCCAWDKGFVAKYHGNDVLITEDRHIVTVLNKGAVVVNKATLYEHPEMLQLLARRPKLEAEYVKQIGTEIATVKLWIAKAAGRFEKAQEDGDRQDIIREIKRLTVREDRLNTELADIQEGGSLYRAITSHFEAME